MLAALFCESLMRVCPFQIVWSRLPPMATVAFHVYALAVVTFTFVWNGVMGPGYGQHYGWILVYLYVCARATLFEQLAPRSSSSPCSQCIMFWYVVTDTCRTDW